MTYQRENRGDMPTKVSATWLLNETWVEAQKIYSAKKVEWKKEFEGLEVDGLRIAEGNLEDSYGNHIAGLPHTQPADVAGWMVDTMDEFLMGGE